MIGFKIEGARKLNNKLKSLEKVPQTCVTKSARAGMNLALRAAKKGSWIDQSGAMRKGMKLVGEKSKKKGKKVYQVAFDRKKNNIFQKKNAQGKVIGYYPASQEYGFFARNGRYIPGFHFMEKAMTENRRVIKNKIVSEMLKNIDKVIKTKGG